MESNHVDQQTTWGRPKTDSLSSPWNSSKGSLSILRSRYRAESGQWKEAAADLEQAVGIAVDHPESAEWEIWRDLTLLELKNDDWDSYRQAIARIVGPSQSE